MKALVIFNLGDWGQQWWSFFGGKFFLKTSVEIKVLLVESCGTRVFARRLMCEIQIATLDLKGPNIFVTNLKLAHFIRQTTWIVLWQRVCRSHKSFGHVNGLFKHLWWWFKAIQVECDYIKLYEPKGCSCLLMHFKSISFHKLTTSSNKLIWLITT